MFDLEQSIAVWRRQMAAGGVIDPKVLDELESHLRDEIEQQMKLRSSELEVFEAAVHRIGQAATLKSEFDNATKSKAARLRRDLWRAFGFSAVMILPCVVVITYVFFPFALQANARYAMGLGLDPKWRVDEMFGFWFRLVVGVGYCVSMPAGLFSLVKVGLLDWRKVAGFRRYALVLHLILAAVLTTPEVVTQILMFVPLQLLFEAAVLTAWIWERKTIKGA